MQTEAHPNHSLIRPRSGYLAGVCEGLGRHFGVTPAWFRLGWIVAVLCFGTGILLYALLWWLMPAEDRVPVEPTIWETESDGRRRPPLRRAVFDRKLIGVCGGLAQRWGVDATLVRLGALALFTVSGGLALIAYGIAAVVMAGPIHQLEPHPVEL